MQKLLIGILAVAVVALGILCAVQTRQLRVTNERARAVEAAAAAESEARETQLARVQELERANARLDQQVQQFTAVTTMLRTNEAQQASNLNTLAEHMRSLQTRGGGGATAGEGKGGLFGKDMGKMLGQMMKDPAMREMMREQQKAAINMMYGPLFKELNLLPEEKEKLRELLTDAQMKNIEGAQGIFGEKKEGSMEDAQKQFADAKKQSDADVKALLGEERFTQYQEYQKDMGERMQVDQLKARMAAENLPLQEQQVTQLLQAMKEEKAVTPPVIPTDQTQFPKKESFTPENLEKQMQWIEDYNRRVLDRAGQILSPEQFKQYREFQDQQTSMQKLGLNMARQMFGNEQPAPPPLPVPEK